MSRTPSNAAAVSLATESPARRSVGLDALIPEEIKALGDSQKAIPSIAKNPVFLQAIETAVRQLPSSHQICLGDARNMDFLAPASVHLILTSPPYWTLKRYRDSHSQMGHIADYGEFLAELERVWRNCFRLLVPGGRLVCVVGDVCLSRRKNGGRHTVIPLHSSIQEQCRQIGFDNLAPIIWYKISNAAYEVQGGSSFLGKPYEPNAVIKNDIEFLLMERKPGGYRSPDFPTKVLSVIPADKHKEWFQQIWSGLTGASTKDHPAPFPLELAERIIRMFSFVGDTVLDPFAGSGTTTVAAAKWGRNSVGIEIDDAYFEYARGRISQETSLLFGHANVRFNRTASR